LYDSEASTHAMLEACRRQAKHERSSLSDGCIGSGDFPSQVHTLYSKRVVVKQSTRGAHLATAVLVVETLAHLQRADRVSACVAWESPPMVSCVAPSFLPCLAAPRLALMQCPMAPRLALAPGHLVSSLLMEPQNLTPTMSIQNRLATAAKAAVVVWINLENDYASWAFLASAFLATQPRLVINLENDSAS